MSWLNDTRVQYGTKPFARAALEKAPGLRLDGALDNGLAFWICGDQLLKGAALNAVQIAELLAEV